MLGGQQWKADSWHHHHLLCGRPETLPANNIGDRCVTVDKVLRSLAMPTSVHDDTKLIHYSYMTSTFRRNSHCRRLIVRVWYFMFAVYSTWRKVATSCTELEIYRSKRVKSFDCGVNTVTFNQRIVTGIEIYLQCRQKVKIVCSYVHIYPDIEGDNLKLDINAVVADRSLCWKSCWQPLQRQRPRQNLSIFLLIFYQRKCRKLGF